MKIGSHYYMHKGSASINSNQANANLNFNELASGTITSPAADDEDVLELSDGAKVHIAESLAGPDGVGDGKQYERIVSFLRKAVEDSLGTQVGNINIDGLEVDARTKTLKTKTATPNELPDLNSYRVSKTNITLQENHITVQGTVKTRDGRELQFDLSLNVSSAVGSQSNLKYRATGDSRYDSPVIAFDGVARELTDTSFQFDSDFSSGLLEGKGTCCMRSAERESVNTGFRRYQWSA